MKDMEQHYAFYNQKATTLFVELILKICRHERKSHRKSVEQVLRKPIVKRLNEHSILGSVIKLELDQVLETGPFQVLRKALSFFPQLRHVVFILIFRKQLQLQTTSPFPKHYSATPLNTSGCLSSVWVYLRNILLVTVQTCVAGAKYN